jgi:hypothetical protein
MRILSRDIPVVRGIRRTRSMLCREMRHSHDRPPSGIYEVSAGPARTSMLNMPRTKEHSPALVIIILETIYYLTALLSVALRESRLGVLFAHGYSFQKQSAGSYRHNGRCRGIGV